MKIFEYRFPFLSAWVIAVSLCYFIEEIALAFRFILDPLTGGQNKELFAAGFGAFFGSGFAFYLNWKHDLKKNKDAEFQAFNEMIFSLVQQIQKLSFYYSKNLEKFKDHVDQYIIVPKFFPQKPANYRINYEKISFLLKTHTIHFQDLSAAQNMFEAAIESINYRNKYLETNVDKFIIEELLPTKKINRKLASGISVEIFEQAKLRTMFVYDSIESGLKQMFVVHDAFQKIAIDLFPGRTVIGMAPNARPKFVTTTNSVG